MTGCTDGGEDGFAFSGFAFGQALGGEFLDPVGEFSFFGLGGVAQLAPDGGEFGGEVGIIQAADSTSLIRGDECQRNDARFHGIEQRMGKGRATDQSSHRSRLLLFTSLRPWIEQNFWNVRIIIGSQSTARSCAEDFVIDQTAHDEQQLRLRTAGEASEGIAPCVGITLGVFDNGDEFIGGTSATEDEGKLARERAE